MFVVPDTDIYFEESIIQYIKFISVLECQVHVSACMSSTVHRASRQLLHPLRESMGNSVP